MEIFDVSVPIRERMPIYDGNPGVRLERTRSIEAGDPANVSRLELGVHTGTHLDAPVHFLPDGGGSESIPLAPLIGPAHVVDATALDDAVSEEALAGLDLPAGVARLLLKTRSSELWGRPTFTRSPIRLTGSGARLLIERGVRLIGLDYLSIGDAEAHRELLSAGVVPLEGLDLRGIEPGPYELVCLPLRLQGSDGVPARAILIRRG